MRVAITGATGTLGSALVRRLYRDGVDRLVALSRDEVKKHALVSEFSDFSSLRAFLGDVRDYDRLVEVFHGCDTVIHAAALKRVESGDDPGELVKTNIAGTVNVIKAAAQCGVGKVLFISSDKAVTATNFYGMTKAVAETYAVQSNSVFYPRGTRIAAVRYGNVVGSRGSVVELWLKRRLLEQPLQITDRQMTRFWLTVDEAVNVVMRALAMMRGGEVFVPKLPSMRVVDMAAAIYPDKPFEDIPVRPGEKRHEQLLNDDEITRTMIRGDMFVVTPSPRSWDNSSWQGFPVAPGSKYTSDTNDRWLTVDEIRLWLALQREVAA